MLTRINNQITAPELRVIDEQGKNIGVFSKEEALRLAAEKELDLIEIAPTASPPVAKIMSFDKFRYQKEKELKKQRSAEKAAEMKQVRVSARAAQNDLLIKAKKVNEFLEDGARVEILMILRGREKYNKDWAKGKLQEFMKLVDPTHKITSPLRDAGKGMIIQISKK